MGRLTERIVALMADGEKWTVESLQRQLGVTRSCLRKAMYRLEGKGVVHVYRPDRRENVFTLIDATKIDSLRRASRSKCVESIDVLESEKCDLEREAVLDALYRSDRWWPKANMTVMQAMHAMVRTRNIVTFESDNTPEK